MTVVCACGAALFKYHKTGTGRLVKCYVERIVVDYAKARGKKTGEHVLCPTCHARVGTVQLIRGGAAVKLNQGAIKNVHIK